MVLVTIDESPLYRQFNNIKPITQIKFFPHIFNKCLLLCICSVAYKVIEFVFMAHLTFYCYLIISTYLYYRKACSHASEIE